MNNMKTSQLRSLHLDPLIKSTIRPPECLSGVKLPHRRDATAVDSMDTTDKIALAVNALAADVLRCVIPSNVSFVSNLTSHVLAHLFQVAKSNMLTLNRREDLNPRSPQCLVPGHPMSRMQFVSKTKLHCCMNRNCPTDNFHDRNRYFTMNLQFKTGLPCK